MQKILNFFSKELQNLEAAGLIQEGVPLQSKQGPKILIGNKSITNFTSANYLGWSDDSRIKKAAQMAIEEYGVGWSSARVVSGTHQTHKKLEKDLSSFLGLEDCALFSNQYQANLGLFECLFSDQDFLFCDFTLGPSLVDSARLSSARTMTFKTQDLQDLEDKLKRSPNARFRAIIIDSVSDQDGRVAPLVEVTKLAEKYDALVIVDDAHGIGVLGAKGRGAVEVFDLANKIDLVSGTFGNALGGFGGGFIAGKRELISWIKQKSRPYLFSESLSPAQLGAAQKAVELLSQDAPEVNDLSQKVDFFRTLLKKSNFEVIQSPHPIVSVILKDAVKTQNMVNRLFQEGFYVLGFCFPVVPKGTALVRFQVTAAHTLKDLSAAADALKR